MEIIKKSVQDSKQDMKIYLKEFKDDQVSQTLETLKPTFGSLVKSLKLKSVYDESLSILSNFPNIEELDLITYPSLNWGETINVDFNGKYPVFERLKVLMITSSYLVMERLLNLTKDIETFFFENDHQTDHENDDKILKYFDQHKNLKYFTINESDGLTNRFTDDALAQFINSHDQLIELDIVICKLDFSFISKLKEHKNLKKLKIESKSTDIANIYLNEKLWNLRSLFIGFKIC